MTKIKIPVSSPALVGNEHKYVMDCLSSNWISSKGKYVHKFEESFAEYCGCEFAISCCNGTTALHLALLALGVGANDEVIVPTFTFVASANAVVYCGATPVFVDSEPGTWNLDPKQISTQITDKTKGIIVVHIYGQPVNMDEILKVAYENNLFVLEDAAEAHGATYHGKRVGALADVGTFSFYGNKIITSGEGGMIVTNNGKIAESVRALRGQCMDSKRVYWFPKTGYNYRMTNIAAAIGLAQLENIDWHIERRRLVHQFYKDKFKSISTIRFQETTDFSSSVFWMTSIMVSQGSRVTRDELAYRLRKKGIETRPFFIPMHKLPMFSNKNDGLTFPVSERLALEGISLPSGANLTANDLEFICDEIWAVLYP